jgi:hypothetical protein
MLTEAGLLMELGSIMMFVCLAFYSFQFLVEKHFGDWLLSLSKIRLKMQTTSTYAPPDLLLAKCEMLMSSSK